MSNPPNDPELNKIWEKVNGLEVKVVGYINKNEERHKWIQKRLKKMNKLIEKLDSRLWWLLGTVILGIVLTLATRLI